MFCVLSIIELDTAMLTVYGRPDVDGLLLLPSSAAAASLLLASPAALDLRLLLAMLVVQLLLSADVAGYVVV